MDVIASATATVAASVAAFLDWRSHRIPNWLTASMVLAGIALNVWRAGLPGAGLAVAGVGLGLAILLPVYVLKGVGAGDVKLLAGLGAVLGPQTLVSVAVYGALVGGLIAVITLVRLGHAQVALHEVVAHHRLPGSSGAMNRYGVAIASGMYLSLVLPGVLG